MAKGVRIDERLVREGLAESRSLAQRYVMAGSVRVDGQRVDKSSQLVRDEQLVELDRPPPYVSRGGEKLANALDDLRELRAELGLEVAGADAIDLGASTGGFSDCLLQRGASRVVAVDVGHGQLHPRLRDDARVTVLERTNARHLEPAMLPFVPDLVVCDASFISLRTLLPAPLACLAPGWWGVLLCKPQFEAGRDRMARHGRRGVLVDPDVRRAVVAEVVEALGGMGVDVLAQVEARPPGPKGNREHALLVRAAGARA